MLIDIHDSDFRPQFVGHETFPLRLLWLKKAYDAVANENATRRTFQEQEAIAKFGVGKNMAISIRHWAIATGIVEDDKGQLRPTKIGRAILDDDGGYDPYLEDPATMWLVHFALAGTPELSTAFFYCFNILNQPVFDRETITSGLFEIATAKSARVTAETLKRDAEVLIRSYVAKKDGAEDAVEPLLNELSLVREQRLANQYEFVRGPKQNLPDAVFALALRRFWRRWHTNAPTLSAEVASYGIGSPGRVFKLDEDSVLNRLSRIGEITNGAIIWTDTAGLRQVSLVTEVNEDALLSASFSEGGRS
ncbi:conserved hypothetical protein [Pseudorhizobium banfieldiae]|uniref:DUF4007 domain-containing protein n=1 Tax=Pseudorhizobium banfieldiae TaxID=1125847 RepID=L0NAM9_9HYPH|nr:DUF4007 family protein [Pseudorhizobium banfieldiae]CAD6600507.1 hypothetical protein RNT25_00767 [arsenite-oxidising bacterium NT-25]CCF18088.1 conserved hypothetical protein [Pseudorhizobium banfieldiae]